MYVDTEAIVQWAALLGAICAIIGLFYKMFKWYERQKQQDADIQRIEERHKKDFEEIQKEQCMICYSLLAVLDGLIQQGANGEVTKAHNKLQKYLNKSAHGANEWEEE